MDQSADMICCNKKTYESCFLKTAAHFHGIKLEEYQLKKGLPHQGLCHDVIRGYVVGIAKMSEWLLSEETQMRTNFHYILRWSHCALFQVGNITLNLKMQSRQLLWLLPVLLSSLSRLVEVRFLANKCWENKSERFNHGLRIKSAQQLSSHVRFRWRLPGICL